MKAIEIRNKYLNFFKNNDFYRIDGLLRSGEIIL